VGDQHRPYRAPHRLGQDGEEGRPDGDRRQHERHRDQGEQGAAAGEPVAGEHVGRSQAQGDGQHRAERGLPEREPQHPARAVVGDDVAERRQRQPAGEHGAEGPQEEDGQEGDRRDQQQPAPEWAPGALCAARS
jgi:hypothetical protein